LSVDQRPFHAVPLGHYARLSSLLDVLVSQSSSLVPLHSVRVMSMHPEGTIGRLRYALGGDRPSQTTPLALSGRRLHGRPLDATPRKSGISPLPPARPRAHLHRLPPILRRRGTAPRPGCSKAPRGLFVLPRVTRIFTGTSISPSFPSRQRPSRYAFRAGRNLPDKEFRYLRTVIVTAAVHRGFRSRLRSPLPFTFRHWAGISPYTSACAVAETCVFGKQSLGPAPCGPLTHHMGRHCPPKQTAVMGTLPGHPFSRSYGVRLPSSLTGNRSSTWGSSPPPTSVGVRYGRCKHILRLEAFLGGLRITRHFRPLLGGSRPASACGG
jgi:hypothetical protein